MNKVLVTGGAGFIGSHIVEKLLDKGYEVAVADNLSSGNIKNLEKIESIQFFNVDITNYEALKIVVHTFDPEYIIHQAAQVSVAASVKDVLNDETINIRGSLNVIEIAKNTNVKKIVFASTAAVYGEPEYLPIDALHRTKPMSPYGLSKYTVEKYLEMSKKLYQLDYTILRYSNVYGPRQDAKGEGGVVAIFSDKISNDEIPTIFGDGNQTRDFVFVEDVAQANVQALKYGSEKILNVSSSERTTINDLFTSMTKELNKSFVPLYKEERQGDIKDSSLSNKETRAILKWEPNFSLKKGLKKTLNYYVVNNKKETISL